MIQRSTEMHRDHFDPPANQYNIYTNKIIHKNVSPQKLHFSKPIYEIESITNWSCTPGDYNKKNQWRSWCYGINRNLYIKNGSVVERSCVLKKNVSNSETRQVELGDRMKNRFSFIFRILYTSGKCIE